METDVSEAQPAVEENKDKGPPKAMVKPQVLTHVIEGYVIQECKSFCIDSSI